ncbi:MAG: acetolactate synthase, large subunit, biosynthetic type [Dehalococcoidaceae bacterium]|nr:acetolactate synthase, large subunit, biosynthetic type [Dehalococcoidaceae bacterium]
MKMIGADIVLESLKKAKIDTLFGYPGGVVLPLYDRFPFHKEIKHILVRHEQAAGHAADAYARVSGKIGVALATSGPGATNLVTAVQNAMMDSIPTLFITGNVARNLIGKDGFQEADATGIFMPTVKHNYLVTQASDLAPTFAEAIHIATTGRPGPVHIDIPKDVFLEEAEFNWPQEINLRGYKVDESFNEASIDEAAKLINLSEKPIIFAGHGIIISNTHKLLKKLSEKADLPVITTLLGIGSMPTEHPLHYGWMGMHGSYYANHAASNADTIIALGMRMDDRALGRFADMNPDAKIVHIDIDPAEHDKNLKATVPVVGNLSDILPTLTNKLEETNHAEWIKWINDLKEEHSESMMIPKTNQLSVQYAVNQIAIENKKNKLIVVTGVGQHQMWAAQHMNISEPRQLITSGGLGTMGFEVPAALGAQVANPKATVWSICGDGGFQMTFQELATIVDEKLPIKFAIMNNGFLGMVRQWQELFYQENLVDVDMSQPNFLKIAEAYGIQGIEVTKKDQVIDAIQKANAVDGPVLIDFKVEVDGNVWPMVPAGAALNETVESAKEL